MEKCGWNFIYQSNLLLLLVLHSIGKEEQSERCNTSMDTTTEFPIKLYYQKDSTY